MKQLYKEFFIECGGLVVLFTGFIGGFIPCVVSMITGVFPFKILYITGVLMVIIAIAWLIVRLRNRKPLDLFPPYMAKYLPFDPIGETAVIRISNRTGEKVVGFVDNATGYFMEVATIHNNTEKRFFMKVYGIKHLKKQY